jgi:Predicted membrane protein (DUF2142)
MLHRMTNSIRKGFQTWAGMPLALFMLVFVVLQGVVMASHTPLSYPPDEIPHLSYIHDSIRSPTVMPNYRDGKIMGFTQPNYLAHPPLYYSGLGAVGKVFALHPKADYLIYRLIGVGLVGLGLAFVVLTARELRLTQNTTALMLFACASVPMFSYIAGSVSNDTLLYTGMTLSFYGMARFANPVRHGPDPLSAVLLLTGLLIVFLTKATGVVFIILMLGGWGLRNLRRLQPTILLQNFWPHAVVFAVIVGGYYAYTWLHHGAFFPTPGRLYGATPPAEPLDLMGYTREFVGTMWRRLHGIMSHLSVTPIADRWQPVFYIMVCLPVVGWLVVRFSTPLLTANRMAVRYFDAVALATLGTVLVHLVFGYRAYLGNGVLSGLQPRYYMYLLPLLWFPFFVLCQPGWFKQAVTTVFAASALVVFWTSSPQVLLKQHLALQELPRNLAYADRTRLQNTPIRLPLRSTLEGNVETLTLTNGELRAKGWAFDTRLGDKVQRIWVMARDEFVSSVPVLIRREDVAAALGTPNALSTGFAFTARHLPTSLQTCDIRLLAEFRDGSVGPLKNDLCPQ